MSKLPAEKTVTESKWQKLRIWIIGLLLLSGLIVVVTHIGEIEQFAVLLRQMQPQWLLLSLLFQLATYVCFAAVWYVALRKTSPRQSLISIIPLCLAKLFTDRAMPSAGISGRVLIIEALKLRGIPVPTAMAAMLLDLLTYYIAYLTAALATILLLYFYRSLQAWILSVVMVFSLISVVIPAAALWIHRRGKRKLPGILRRMPGLSNFMKTISDAPTSQLRNPGLMAAGSIFHAMIFILDAATLWVMLEFLGIHVSFWAVYPSYVFASILAIVSLIPLGLGSFEVTCVTMLSLTGVPKEAALTATLLLRGFALWLPMLPGMWLTRRALIRGKK